MKTILVISLLVNQTREQNKDCNWDQKNWRNDCRNISDQTLTNRKYKLAGGSIKSKTNFSFLCRATSCDVVVVMLFSRPRLTDKTVAAFDWFLFISGSFSSSCCSYRAAPLILHCYS